MSASLRHVLGLPMGVGAGGVGGTAFNAPLTSSVVPANGTLGSFTRTSVATVTDFEGMVKKTKAEEARFVGARRVENTIPVFAPEDIVLGSGTVEGYTTDPEGGQTAIRMKSDATTLMAYLAVVNSEFSSTDDGVLRVWLRCNQESLTVPLMAGSFSGIDVTVTNQWQCFSVSGNPTGTTAYIGIMSALGSFIEVDMWRPQYEIVTGQENQNPSEYISVGMGTEPERVDDTEFDDVSKWNASVITVLNGQGTLIVNGDIESDPVPAVIGRHYHVIVDVVSLNGGTSAISLGNDGAVLFDGVNYFVFTALDTSPLRCTVLGNGATLNSISVREIQHGSNVDGVKYFDTLNYNSVIDNIVTVVDTPAGDGVQQLSDPEFNTPATLPTSDWSVTVGDASISGGVLTMAASTIISITHAVLAGVQYRLEYKINSGSVFGLTFGGTNLPKDIGSYDFIVTVSGTLGSFDIQDLAGGGVFEYVRVTPVYKIPDDIIKGILIEEESTNLYLYSQDLSKPAWGLTKVQTPSESAILVSGLPAWEMKPSDVTDTEHNVYQILDKSANATVFISAFMAKGTKDFGVLKLLDVGSTATAEQFFNLSTGVLANSTNSGGDVTLITASITEAKNGYRCVAVFSSGSGITAINIAAISETDTSISYVGTTGEVSGLVTGLHSDSLLYPTSYIRTLDVPVTRNNDNLDYVTPAKLILTDLSKATVLATVESVWVGDSFPLLLKDTVSTDEYGLTRNNTGEWGSLVTNNPATGSTVGDQSIVRTKLASSFNGSELRLVQDGVFKQADPTAPAFVDFAVSMIHIGYDGTGNYINGTIRNTKVYNKVLSDTIMQEFTS